MKPDKESKIIPPETTVPYNLLGETDPLLDRLECLIRMAVKILAVLMTIVIFWAIIDVVWVIYEHIADPPYFLLNIHDIFTIFGAFMAVLIAMEIFVNITMYLREHVLQVKMVVATALMAASRKIIILDLKEVGALEILAVGMAVLSLGLTYWLLTKKSEEHTAKKLTVESEQIQDKGC